MELSTGSTELSTGTEKPLAHHKVPIHTEAATGARQGFSARIIYKIDGQNVEEPYGVPSPRRIISPGLLNAQWDQIRRFLTEHLFLTTAEREAIFRLLKMATRYSNVYPKASQIAELPGCSVRTFWRAVAKVKDAGLITVINRFLVREEAQISNLYVLTKLCLAIARYLQEHSVRNTLDAIQHFMEMPARRFWRAIKKWPWRLQPGAT